MPEKKPWEKFSSTPVQQNTTPSAKPWEKFSGETPVKKKSSESPGTMAAGFGTSAAERAKEESGRLASSASKGDGIYSIESQPTALYKKDNGKWFVDVNKTGEFQPLAKGDVSAREKVLEAKSSRYVDPDYERNLTLKFETKPENTTPKAAPTEKQVRVQKSFDKDFKVLDESDPVVVRRNKVDEIAKTASKAVFMEEEPAVDVLRKSFAGTDHDIFDFQEYGAGDKMRIENKHTGQYLIVDLDNSSGKDAENERQLLEAFIDVNLEFPEYDELSEKRKQLINQIDNSGGLQRSNYEKELSDLDSELRVVESRRRGYALSSGDHMAAVVNQKYDKVGNRNQQKVLTDDIGMLTTRAIRLKQDAEEVAKEKKVLDDGLKNGFITPEEYQQKINDPLFKSTQDAIKTEYQTITNESRDLAIKADVNEQLAAKSYMALSERGDAASLAIGSFVKGFTGTIATLAGEDITGAKDRPFFDESLSELLPGELTEEYVNNPNLAGWQKALAGISESLGAAISLGPAGAAESTAKLGLEGIVNAAYKEGIRKTAWGLTKGYVKKSMTPDQIGLFINSYSNFRSQMDSDPDFKDVSEGEKITLAAAYGIVSSKLERFGLTKSIAKTPIGKNLNAYILKNVFSQLPKDASSELIESTIEGSIKGLISKGVLNTAGGAFIEGSTEAAQEIADMTLKSAYNEIKGKDYFDNPKTFAEALERTGESFKLGMIGGAMMGGVSQTLQVPAKARTAIQMDVLQKTIENPDIKSIFENNIKVKVINGEISKDNAKAQLKELNESQALLEKIPDGVKDKYVPFKLLAEKQELEAQIHGKDPALVAVQKERVAAIDEKLKVISIESAKVTSPKVETSIAADPDPDSFPNPKNRKTAVVEEVVESSEDITAESSVVPETIDERFASSVVSQDPQDRSVFVESVNESLDRGVPHQDLTKAAEDSFIKEGFSPEEASRKAYETLKPVFEEQGIAPTVEEVLQEKTNLTKVYDFLDNIDKNLGEYTAPNKLNDITSVLPAKVLQVVVKALKVSVQAGMTLEQAIKDYASKNQVNESDITNSLYSVSDAQQSKMRERVAGQKQAPAQTRTTASVAAKSISKKIKTPIVVDEYKALVDTIKREARAAKDKKAQVKDVLTNISAAVKQLTHTETREGKFRAKKGSISLKQTNSILSAMKGLNLDNEIMVDRFTDYIGNVVAKAEFVEKVDEALTLRKRIKKSFGKKGVNGKSNPFVTIAKGFSEINPKWVEDIDVYLNIANKVREGLKPTSVRGENVTFKNEASTREVGEYTAREQELQDEITAENIRLQYERITGESGSGMSAGDMKSNLLELSKKKEDAGDTDLLDQVKQALRDKLKEFNDTLDGDTPLEVQEALKADIDILDTRTAIRLLDALDSYAVNGSVGGLRAQLASYRGLRNAKDSKLKATSLRLAGSKKIGRFQNEQFTNMNILTERLFKGVQAGAAFRKESGIQEIVNGANKAEAESTQVQNEYLKKFAKTKDFDSAENIFERGVIGFLRRNTISGDTQVEFDRRKKLLKDSVSALKKGNELERKKGDLYAKVLGKLQVESANNVGVVEEFASKTNIEAVDFITDMWSDLYPDLSDFSLGVHNILLPRDSNYTPDKFSSMENSKSLEDQVDQNSFGFGSFNNLILDKNEAGVLIESKKPKALPKGKYIDLDFESNMFRSHRLALTDMYTAEPIRQAYSYMKSPEFEEMIISEDRGILQTAVSDYVTAKKGKAFTDRDTFEYLKKLNNFIASMGAARALSGLGQFINQYSTAMTNTFVNTGFNLRPGEVTNKEAMEFINRSGRAIANRGVDVVTTIDKADNIVESAKIGGKLSSVTIEPLAKVNTFMLKWLLSKPDVLAARASWLAYYRKSMKKQGLEVDYLGEVNDEAADYAQSMIDRNMDISDTELRGKFFRDKSAVKGFVKQVFFPFATFALNQKNRLWSDAGTLTSKTASREDKNIAARSVSALVAETAVYNSIRYFLGKAILESALEALDMNDDEKEEYREKYNKNLSESVLQRGITDILSPTPLLDNALLGGSNKILMWSGMGGASESEFTAFIDEINKQRYNEYQDPLTESEIDKKRKAFFEEKQFQFFVDDEKSFGVMGIQVDKTIETYDLLRAYFTGEYTQESKFGDSEKIISKEGQEKLLLPALMKIGASLALPREADQLANRMYSVVKKKYGMTDGQSEKIEALKKLGYAADPTMMKLVKTSRKVDGIADELNYMKKLSAAEKKEYLEKELGI